ncbi:asparagine synthase (glutamine-hydrolyzing) [Patescibacteria group bacterium]|nr:asparagine synthase (glutamine-hydrolyzing) [Patescibacteria group bacterium]
MCGICGLYNLNKNWPASREEIERMKTAIKHRGPDDEGIFCHQNAGLGYQRLSIIDTTSRPQPILTNEDQSLRISFNGEIYNFPELRKELLGKGHCFYTDTDTETILHLYEEEGENCVKRLNGIFALAIYDLAKGLLFLARDPMGVKPLYYTGYPASLCEPHYASASASIGDSGTKGLPPVALAKGGRFAFASEIKALLTLPWVKKEVNLDAVPLYFRYRFTPDPLTMFKNIYKLSPGCWMKVTESGIEVREYDDPNSKLQFKIQNEEQVVRSVRQTMQSAVQRQLLSDVPLGAFLSGGVDSSIIVGLMSQIMSEPVKTFSIGFSESEYDEMQYARQISRRYGTDHHEVVLSPRHVKALPEIVRLLDEPLADAAAVPFYFLSQLARKEVTVVLTGEGGDELFAGYKENFPYSLANLFKILPASARRGTASLIARMPNMTGKTRLYRSVLPDKDRAEHILTDLFRYEKPPLEIGLNPIRGFNPKKGLNPFNDFWRRTASMDWLSKMLYLETAIWLPGDPLMKVDKMTMAHALEARVPFLDLEVVELAGQIPSHLKNKNGIEKYLLREAFKDLLPMDILARKKFAFEIPIREWLQNELKPIVREYLSEEKLEMSGLLDAPGAHRLVKQHLEGRKDYKFELWALLCFQLWYDQWFVS